MVLLIIKTIVPLLFFHLFFYYPFSKPLFIHTTPESERTSAADTLVTGQFNDGLIQSVPDLFYGRVPGLIVSRPGSNPDEWIEIRMRGLNSIYSRTTPLIVIDGIITENIDLVHPNDVERIEFLKDAASASRYGVRGNAGVIRISTKKGPISDSGRLSVNYHGNIASSFIANWIDVLNANEYRDFLTNTMPDRGIDFGSTTNWQEQVKRTGMIHLHNLSITAGRERTIYRLSGTFTDMESILQGAGYSRLNGRAYFSHEMFNNLLTISTVAGISNRKASLGQAEIFRYATTSNPTAPVFDENGNYFEIPGFDQFNPVSILNESVIDSELQQKNLRLTALFDFSRFIDGLHLNSLYSRETYDHFRGEYYGRELRFRGADNNGYAIKTDTGRTIDFFETSLIYRLQTGKINAKTEAGYNYHKFRNINSFIEGIDFESDELFYNILTPAVHETQTIITNNSLIGFFGEISASYDKALYGALTIRQEGSSRFGMNKKWGTFYGIRTGAELTRLFDLPHLNSLFIRLSHGKTGQDAPFDGLSVLKFIEPHSGRSIFPNYRGIHDANPDLKWEVKKEWNVGADISIFDKNLDFKIDFFINRATDLLYEVQQPSPPNLTPYKWVNLGEIENRGVEAAVTFKNHLFNRVDWNTTLLFSKVNTLLISLSDNEFNFDGQIIANPGAPGMGSAFLIRLQEKGKIGNFWGPEFAGIDSEGRWQFRVQNNQIVPMDELIPADYKIIGNAMPDFTIGWGNIFSVSGWDLQIFWYGVFGHDIVNSYRLFYENPTMIQAFNITRSAREIPLTDFPIFSDYYVEDGSYFRLSNLTLGYSFENPLYGLDKHLKLYVSGNNLWTITRYNGIDPEIRFLTLSDTSGGSSEFQESVFAPGIERRNNWPTQTTILAGVIISF